MTTKCRLAHNGVLLHILLFALLAGLASGQSDDGSARQSREPVYGSGINGDLTVPANQTTYLYEDKEYETVTINFGGTLDTRGHVVKVCDTLTNYGTITDGYSGGSGGAGGAGGQGADPLPDGPSTPDAGIQGGPGASPSNPKAGAGGHGGGGGGGGGGANTLYPKDTDAYGGDGGDAGGGGKGGGYVEIWAYHLNNYGAIHADGKKGDDAEAHNQHRDGEYYQWQQPLRKDLAGGGGGGGGGGFGGNGGTVQIYYAFLLDQGEMRANGGDGGDGGARGVGHYLSYGVALGEHSAGAPGAYPGGGSGGRGAHEKYDSSGNGQTGTSGSEGAYGDVFIEEVIPPVPIPDVKVNGDDGPLTVTTSDDIVVTIHLDPGDLDGEPADWWVFGERNTTTTWWAKYRNGQKPKWTKSGTPIRLTGATLRTVNSYTVLGPTTLPVGDWVFSFAVDANKDGVYDAHYIDTVEVRVN